MADKEIIISRMQQRRGNRIDLPQPLRAGEIALASDSKEVFIGLDPKIGVTAQNANVVTINNIPEGFNYANSYLNNNFIRLIMPSKRFPTGTFNGTANSTTFTVKDDSGQAHGQKVFNETVTGNATTNLSNIKNVFDGNAFESTDFTGAKNGVALSTNATRSTANLLNNEFFVSSPISSGENTTITFGSNPTGTDDITINYYSNADIISAMFDTGVIGTTSTTGFYEAKSVASFRQFNNAYIRSDYEVGTAFIGLENKHTEVFADSGTVGSPAGLTLTDIILEAAPDLTDPTANVIAPIDLSSASNLDLVVSTINNDATFRATKVAGTENQFFISCDSQFQVRFTDNTDATELSLTDNATYTKADHSIKGQLEDWIHDSLNDEEFNMFVTAEVGNKFNSNATNIGQYTPSTSSENLTLTFTGNQEAENFSTITNKLFGASENSDITGLTNVKTNQRLLTQDDYAVLLTGSANSLFEAITKSCPAGATGIVTFSAVDVTAVIVEYSVTAAGGTGNAYSRTGTIHLTANQTLQDASLNDTGAVMQNGFGTSTFDLSTTYDDSTNTFVLTATNNLTDGTSRTATFKYIVRKWLG